LIIGTGAEIARLIAVLARLYERDGPITPKAFHALFGRIGARAKTPFPVHPHMLRHLCGCALANAGHDSRALQAWLGHKNIQHSVAIPSWRRTGSKLLARLGSVPPDGAREPTNAPSCPDLAGRKRLELLRESVPSLVNFAVLWNPANRAEEVARGITNECGQPLRRRLTRC
jgi:hypothetical protein